MKKSTHHLLFFTLVLVWYFLVFELLWCRHGLYNGACKQPAYVEVGYPTAALTLSSECFMSRHNSRRTM